MTAFFAYLPYKAYRFSGEDTLKFLQGQLTQDISLITNKTCHYGGYCDVKGRMLANFLIHQDDKGYLLRLHQSLANNVIKRLEMFILRAKVNVEPVSMDFIGLNKTAVQLLTAQANIDIPSNFNCVHTTDFTLSALPSDYFELSMHSDSQIVEWLSTITENTDEIEQLRLSGGHFNVLRETNEKIMPQQTPLESWEAINYQKGCFVGQEVIARNKYRGKITKGMGYAIIDTPLYMNLPATISHAGKPVGQVIEYHRTSTKTLCLGILALDSLSQPVTVSEQPTSFTTIE